MKANVITNLKVWYMDTYPTDELGVEINPKATFESLFESLDNYEDVYDHIEVYDSIVRERLFEGLCEASGHTYDEVYEQWMRGI